MRPRPLALIALLACGTPPKDVPGETDAVGGDSADPGVDTDPREDTDPPVAQTGDLPTGGSVVRRLSVRELRHALADLVGVEVAADVTFPADVRVAGFDQHGDAGQVSDLVVEQLERAAEDAGEAWSARALPVVHRSAVGSWEGLHGCEVPALGHYDALWAVWLDAPLHRTVQVSTAGTYVVQLDARYRHAEWGTEDGRVALEVDGKVVASLDVHADDSLHALRGAVTLTAGPHVLTAHYVGGLASEDDFFYPGGTEALPLCYLASGVAFGDVELRGPAHANGDALGLLEAVVADLAARAWRRPITAAERARLRTVVEEVLTSTDDVGFALASAAHAVFLSPHFLLVLDRTTGSSAPYPLDAHALASRLALALWSSVPDDTLRACATSFTLTRLDAPDCGLLAQVDRMVADPRFLRTVDAFTRQWLDLDTLAALTPPLPEGVDRAAWLADVAEETVDLVTAHLDDPDARPLDLVTASTSWPSAELAAYLGLPRSPAGAVDLVAAGRQGLLGQTSVHAMGASGALSSPVRRGIWVLDKLVCDPPDPPPANVPRLPEDRPTPADVVGQLEQHRTNPTCAQCHDRIDPIGLALEGFGADGRARTPPVLDMELDGQPLSTYADLVAWLGSNPGTEACLVSWLATHQTGLSITPEQVQATGWLDGASWQATLRRILASSAFTHRSRPGVSP